MDPMSTLKRLVDKHGPCVAAGLIGVSYPTVWRWLSGKHRITPSMAKLVMVAGASDEQSAVLETPDKP